MVDHASGLKFEVGDADSVLHKQDILRTFHVDVQGALFVPLGRWSFVGPDVFQEFNGHVRKRLICEVAGHVGEVAFGEADFSLLDFYDCG